LSTASAVAVAIGIAVTVITAWRRGPAISTLALGSTTAALSTAGLRTAALRTAALRARALPTPALSAATTTGPRLATRVSLPLSAFCRAHQRGRRDDHDCCDEEWFDAHTF